MGRIKFSKSYNGLIIIVFHFFLPNVQKTTTATCIHVHMAVGLTLPFRYFTGSYKEDSRGLVETGSSSSLLLVADDDDNGGDDRGCFPVVGAVFCSSNSRGMGKTTLSSSSSCSYRVSRGQ